MLTVACVQVRGHLPYPADYVRNLASMVRRHLKRPHRFVCLTDKPKPVARYCEVVEVPQPRGLKGWWSKVRLFDPRSGLTGRVLYLDLDTLVVDALDPIVDFPAPFALIPHYGEFVPQNGRRVVRRYNSSVMVWDAGTQDELWQRWTPMVARQLWGDQDWIGEQCPDAATMPAEWFPRMSQLDGQKPTAPAKVVLVKVPKNIEAAQKWPWFAEQWRAA